MKMSTGKHSLKLHLVLLALLIAVVGFVIWLYTGYLWDDVQDLELIQYLESLARIELTPAEEATVGDQLQELLTYIDTLSQLDTDGVEAKSHCFPVTNVFRKDQVEVHMTPEEVVANAPESQDGAFVVPKTVE